MAIESINDYLSTSSTTSTTSTSTTSTADTDATLDMDDFLTLMVAQLQNQDMYNSVDNTEFMSQMAQYSMVQALTDMNELSQTTYNISLIGKEVTLTDTDSDGSTSVITGTVESVNLNSDDAEIVIGGITYPVSSITKVSLDD